MNRTLKTLLVAASAGLLLCNAANAQTYTPEQKAAHARLYKQAQTEFRAGKLDAAEIKARALVRARPGDPYMRRLLVAVQTAKRQAMAGTPWERRLRGIVVPTVEIDESTLEEVLEYVRAKAIERLPEGTDPPSFVVRGEAKDRLISFRLSNIPLSEVLRLAGELADVRFSYERYAIIAHDTRPSETGKPAPRPPLEPPSLEGVGTFPAVVGHPALSSNPLEAIVGGY